MGANGSFASGSTATEEGRRWRTIAVLPSGAKVIELKNPRDNHKAPEESHSPNAVYVFFNKNGDGIKSVSKYDNNGKKTIEIHTVDHKGLGPHYHPWENGRPTGAKSLTPELKKLLDDVKSLI